MNTKESNAIPELDQDLFLFDVGLLYNSNQVCVETDYQEAVSDVVLSLKSFIKESARVCIIVDDYTRSTPTAEILSFLMPALEDKGIKKGNVFFLFASGSHRLMNEEEKRARLSDEIFENYRSIDHPFYHPTLHHLYTFNNFIYSRIFLLAHVKNEQAMPEKLIRHTKA